MPAKLDLSASGLHSLSLLVPVLASLPDLQDLNLRGNQLRTIHVGPLGHSSLRNVRKLDLSVNPLSSVRDTVKILDSEFPKLKD